LRVPLIVCCPVCETTVNLNDGIIPPHGNCPAGGESYQRVRAAKHKGANVRTGKLNGPWLVSPASDMKEYGWMEDYMAMTEVFFLVASNRQGYRYIGPVLGNSREGGGVEAMRTKAEAAAKELNDKGDFDPQGDPDWGQWFPVYGSEAYEVTGQDAAYIDAEKTGRPYYQAGW
jgi:hypothetical protein